MGNRASDPQSCAWRTFPDKGCYRGKCDRNSIADPMATLWLLQHNLLDHAPPPPHWGTSQQSTIVLLAHFPDKGCYRESSPGTASPIRWRYGGYNKHNLLDHAPPPPPPSLSIGERSSNPQFCSWRIFPDKGCYRGKSARNSIADPMATWRL